MYAGATSLYTYLKGDDGFDTLDGLMQQVLSLAQFSSTFVSPVRLVRQIDNIVLHHAFLHVKTKSPYDSCVF